MRFLGESVGICLECREGVGFGGGGAAFFDVWQEGVFVEVDVACEGVAVGERAVGAGEGGVPRGMMPGGGAD